MLVVVIVRWICERPQTSKAPRGRQHFFRFQNMSKTNLFLLLKGGGIEDNDEDKGGNDLLRLIWNPDHGSNIGVNIRGTRL